jgi:hypothetical protein
MLSSIVPFICLLYMWFPSIDLDPCSYYTHIPSSHHQLCHLGFLHASKILLVSS